ncbi:MAG TPA: diguanylate cyclase [Candidatus Acidoferrum sp.]|nr:diguanylate cyclase [Candidatus Acidoferrum sp.]
MRILIAEDDAISRTLLERTLQRAGYDVIAVENGDQALVELVKQDAPRLALLDWIMPEKDGVEVCREVRKRKEQAYTYLILLSSRESKQDIVAGLESGADDYLTKPFDVDELKARLRTGERILELEDRLVEARESMRFQATHDLLTSLWNRGVIVELVSREIMRSRRERSCTAVMMCDLDHFKSINDQYGHAVGDEVLREVARRLHLSVRSYDMVGRYGGEEFLVALNKCDAGSAVSRAENLRALIGGRPIQTAVKPVTVTISIGLALSHEFTDCPIDEIMRQADVALYAAKAAGRNCVRVAQPGIEFKGNAGQPKESPVLTP